MITIGSTAVAVNDSRSNMTLRMDRIISVRPSWSVGYILNRIVSHTTSGPVQNVVFNCHGSPGFLQMGVGIRQRHTRLFRRLRGKVEKIWLYACSPAARTIGKNFCSSMARAVGCYVVASPDTQWETAAEMAPGGLPPNTLDSFEGKVISFGPGGTVTWTRSYPGRRECSGSCPMP